jgi:hypothetical protein
VATTVAALFYDDGNNNQWSSATMAIIISGQQIKVKNRGVVFTLAMPIAEQKVHNNT